MHLVPKHWTCSTHASVACGLQEWMGTNHLVWSGDTVVASVQIGQDVALISLCRTNLLYTVLTLYSGMSSCLITTNSKEAPTGDGSTCCSLRSGVSRTVGVDLGDVE